jgi:hypothetical protein
MKTMLFTTLALSIGLATPAISQTVDRAPDRLAPDQLSQYQPRSDGFDAFAQDRDVRIYSRAPRSITPRNDVYEERGNYIGSDPDPRVRDQMRRDPSQGD